MPMPEGNTVWPPEHVQPVFKAIATNKTLYRGPEAPDLTSGTGWVAKAQSYGGVVGAIARVLWGEPVSTQTRRPDRHHVPVPADIATLSADLLFSEAPRILPPDTTSDEAKARIDTVVNNATNHSKFLEAAELAAALCGVYLRIVWDDSVADHPMLDIVYPDQAVPVWRWGELTEVTFWNVVETDNGRVWRHLEHHTPGRIEHALFKGEKDNLGQLVPLVEHDSTAWLAEYVDADSGMPTGTEHLTAAYIPNALPSRQYGDNPDTAPYGRSDYEGVEQLFLDLDDAYTSWMRDIRLAKSRLFVDEHALVNNGPGRGQSFDADHEVYTRLRGYGAMSDNNKSMVEAQQFAIRDAEHRETIKHILANILRATGYSPSTFGEEAPSAQTTAKEIRSREQASKRTWTKKQRHWEAHLKPLLETLLEVDAALFESSPIPAGQAPELEFKISNSLEGDLVDLASTISTLHAADAMSLDQMLRMMYPNWSRQQLNEEADKIRAERPWLQDLADPETEGKPGSSFADRVAKAAQQREQAEQQDS